MYYGWDTTLLPVEVINFSFFLTTEFNVSDRTSVKFFFVSARGYPIGIQTTGEIYVSMLLELKRSIRVKLARTVFYSTLQ